MNKIFFSVLLLGILGISCASSSDRRHEVNLFLDNFVGQNIEEVVSFIGVSLPPVEITEHYYIYSLNISEDVCYDSARGDNYCLNQHYSKIVFTTDISKRITNWTGHRIDDNFVLSYTCGILFIITFVIAGFIILASIVNISDM